MPSVPEPHWFQETAPGRVSYVLAHLPPELSSCLDVGNVGGGSSSHEDIRQHVETRGGIVVGCDFSLAAALKARHPRQVVGNVLALPFADGLFDVVYMGQVIEHLWTPLVALQEVRRALKDGGYLLLDTPHVYAIGRMVRWVLRSRDSIGDPDHKLFYTPAILVNLLTESGFEMQDMCTDRKLDVWRWRLPWVPWAKRLGSHLLVTAMKV